MSRSVGAGRGASARVLRSVTTVVLAVGLVAGSSPLTTRAAQGDLDVSFGTGGVVETSAGNGRSAAHSIAVQNDGKIVAVGAASSGGFLIVRLNPDGTPDASFGTAGKVTSDVGLFGVANAVALQVDRRIVVAGTTAPGGYCCQIAVARYNPDGSLDTGFDGDGKLTTYVGGITSAYGVAVDADGRIVVIGSTYNPIGPSGVLVVRYNANGSLDTGFGVGGKVITDLGGSSSTGEAVALRSDGMIIVAGAGGPSSDFAVLRYTASGALDPTFGSAGVVLTDFGGFDAAHDVALDSVGRIVAAGRGHERFAVARYSADGAPDLSFGIAGKVTTQFYAENIEEARAVAIQADGKIIAGGAAFHNYSRDFAIARYMPDGTLDPSFGVAGEVTTHLGDRVQDAIEDLALQADGMILAAGDRQYCTSPCGFVVARYLGDRIDLTPPAISVDQTPNANANGWNNTAVAVTWHTEDPESGISTTVGCEPTAISQETSLTTLVCSATNGAGLKASLSHDVRIDLTAPIVAYTNNLGAYEIDDVITIVCSASDALSGVANSDCADISGPAYGFDLGSNNVTAWAIDRADNRTDVSTSFTVAVTYGSLCGLSRQFETSQDVADSMCDQLLAAAAADARGDVSAKTGILKGYVALVRAQAGKSITSIEADLLMRFVSAL